MKCPRCGAEMTVDSHRKIPLNMCYECGYIEGRSLDDTTGSKLEGVPAKGSNFARLKGLNLTETAAFLSEGLRSIHLDVDVNTIVKWLTDTVS